MDSDHAKRAVRVSIEAPDNSLRRTELAIELGIPVLYDGTAPLLDAGSEHAAASGDAVHASCCGKIG